MSTLILPLIDFMNFNMNIGKYLNVTIVLFIRKHLKKIRKENQKIVIAKQKLKF